MPAAAAAAGGSDTVCSYPLLDLILSAARPSHSAASHSALPVPWALLQVWCPLTRAFAREYLNPHATVTQRQLLYVMNPAKLRACQFLVQYHEQRCATRAAGCCPLHCLPRPLFCTRTVCTHTTS